MDDVFIDAIFVAESAPQFQSEPPCIEFFFEFSGAADFCPGVANAVFQRCKATAGNFSAAWGICAGSLWASKRHAVGLGGG